MSGYQDFAVFYDELTGNVDYSAISGFLHKRLTDHGIRQGIVLDLACGTGNICEIFDRLGYDMIGADASEEMLSQAWDKKIESGAEIIYLNQQMQQLDLFGTVDAVFCTLDSLNHLNDKAELLQTFQRVSLFLNPDGVFIFDCNTPYKHREVLGDRTFVYDCDAVYCVWQNTPIGDDTVQIHLDLFRQVGDGLFDRTEETFCETAFSRADLLDCLEQAGLTLLEEYDDYTENPPCDTTQRVVYVTRKKG